MAGSIALDIAAQASFNKSLQNLIKNEKRKKESVAKSKRGVVYVTHIPHGFYEEQMKSYFGQFGTVTNVKLARSRKSGKSKGYAFIEFEHAEVAQVVAETMNNYIMCNRLLKAEYIPHERIGGKNFWKSNVTAKSYPRLRNRRRDIFAKNAEKPEERVGMLLRKRHQHVESIIEKLNAHGISYSLKEFDAPAKEPKQPPTPVLEIDESDEEIEFRIRPDFSLKKILKKSKKSSSSKKRKADSSKSGVICDGNCKSPEPKLHLMNVKKNLFGNFEKSSSKTDDQASELEHMDEVLSFPSDDMPMPLDKSARKRAGKKQVPGTQLSQDSTSAKKGNSPKTVKPKRKKMAEKFSARLQKKLTRRHAAQQKDVSVNESAIDKFTKKLSTRKNTAIKAASDGKRKNFSSKKLTIKGKLRGFVELGV